jgi:dTDP-4-dehydrorhamnose reductase
MTSLVIGASGQVGSLLYQLCQEVGPCVGTYWHHIQPHLVPFDLTDRDSANDLIREVRPDVCFVPAGLTFMDYAEDHVAECRRVNVLGVTNVAEALALAGGLLVFFSTEHVFGEGRQPRREDEPPAPISAYAQSKVDAEQTVRAILPDRHLILRTSWVYGPDPQRKNFFYRVRDLLSRHEALTVPADQHGQPTYGPDLAQTAWELVRREARGIYHVVGPHYLTRLEWARMIARGLGLQPDLIQGRATSVLGARAPRPLHVRLDRQKLLDFLGRDPIRCPWDGIRRFGRTLDKPSAAR